MTNPRWVNVWTEIPDSMSGTHPEKPALLGYRKSSDRNRNGGGLLLHAEMPNEVLQQGVEKGKVITESRCHAVEVEVEAQTEAIGVSGWKLLRFWSVHTFAVFSVVKDIR